MRIIELFAGIGACSTALKRLGFDKTYISRIESGKQNITIETLIRICDGIGIPLKNFFDFD